MSDLNVCQLTERDFQAVESISERIIGYSGPAHYAFFKSVMSDLSVSRMLILGVYHGRDIAFILDCAKHYRPEILTALYGVDKFTDSACADWPEEKKAMNWRDAGFGIPPDCEKATRNIISCVGIGTEKTTFTIQQSDDSEYLEHQRECRGFDVIYLDTSHDYETVSRQLRQVRGLCTDNALICGDDYSDQGTWGVKRAVSEAFTTHEVFADWIWFSKVGNLRK